MASSDGYGAQQKPDGLPMDVMLEIAGATGDPATVVRLAATCKDLRRYIGDPSSFCRRRLRLRRGEQLPSYLGGQVVGRWGKDLYVEDRDSNLIATGCFRHDKQQKPCIPIPIPIVSRDGLVLVRVHHPWGTNAAVDLRVCCPATGRVRSLPPGPEFKGQFVLLVGDGEGNGAIGRPFKVLNVASVAAGLWYRERRHCFKFRTFSSERGTWGPSTRRWAPGRHKYSYCSLPPLPGRHLVLGDAVHWLYRHRWHDTYYVFKLDVGDDGEAGLTTSTMLPPSFHSECEDPRPGTQKILLAETAGSLVVLVANHGRISAWTMSEDGEAWTDKPQVVIGYEAMKRFGNVQESSDMGIVQLDWFAERTGIVQVTTKHCGFFWLHLQSKKIIRHFQGSLYTRSCPYYMDLSSWFPTLTYDGS